ncbi:hypothetical protein K438DRAFT_1978338 [Mycena galopus ATCC 62051]|nr:hypothetical protein K438DRAFT_1978338 [Mycena galopus ATCC 62051]
MTKESAAHKNKRRREKRAGPAFVSVPNHLAAPPFPHPSQWPDDVRAFVYGPASADDSGNLEPPTVPIASVWTVPQPASVSWADDTAETFPLPLSLPPHDWAALRSDTAHPWRTIRCRNHRLRPQRPERRPFARSLPKILSLHHLSPPPSPAVVDIPPDPVTAAPTFPARTAYGLVHSNLARACAHELPDVSASFQEILEIAGSPPEDREDLLGALPPDQLVFLSTLAAIAALDRVFQRFLYPVIADFADRWVAHLRGDSFG